MLLTHWCLANLQVVPLSLFLGPEFGFSSILEKDETNVSIAIHPSCPLYLRRFRSSSSLLQLGPEPHLRPGELPQSPQKSLILDPRPTAPAVPTSGVSNAEDLRQTHLPWRVAVEFHVGPEDEEEVGFAG
jgi:hypothetical protein